MPWHRRIAIIGSGRMGRWFARFFSNEGIPVTVSDVNKDALRKVSEELDVLVTDNVTAIKRADSVLLAVPIDCFRNVVQEISLYLRPNQAVMDICSVKEAVVDIMHEYIKTGVALGTHPLFGPGAEKIEGQGWVLTPTNSRERELAKEVGGWLEKRGARVYSMSPREHDRLMSLTLAFPHFVGLAACDTLTRSGRFLQAKKSAGSTYKLLLTLAEAVASEDPNHYASIQPVSSSSLCSPKSEPLSLLLRLLERTPPGPRRGCRSRLSQRRCEVSHGQRRTSLQVNHLHRNNIQSNGTLFELVNSRDREKQL